MTQEVHRKEPVHSDNKTGRHFSNTKRRSARMTTIVISGILQNASVTKEANVTKETNVLSFARRQTGQSMTKGPEQAQPFAVSPSSNCKRQEWSRSSENPGKTNLKYKCATETLREQTCLHRRRKREILMLSCSQKGKIVQTGPNILRKRRE